MVVVISLIIVVSVLLMLLVLAQNSKGGGLAAMGGSGTAQMMGVKRTSDLLEKLTWGFAIALFVLTLATNLMLSDGNQAGFTSPNIQRAEEQQTVLPNMGNDLMDEGAAEESLPAETTDTTAQ